MHPSTSVKTPALRSIGNIVTGDDLQTQVVIASGALAALRSLLSSPKDGIRKEACWSISNITAGSPPQIQAVIDANIVPPLIDVLRNGDFRSRKEACWALSNATSGGLQEPAQIRYLVSQGVIGPLCDLLQMMDNKMIQVALDGLENILKVGELDRNAAGPNAVNQYAVFVEEAGGMVSIHNLQQHDNLEIYKKVHIFSCCPLEKAHVMIKGVQHNGQVLPGRRGRRRHQRRRPGHRWRFHSQSSLFITMFISHSSCSSSRMLRYLKAGSHLAISEHLVALSHAYHHANLLAIVLSFVRPLSANILVLLHLPRFRTRMIRARF
jgi:hypothetical protein